MKISLEILLLINFIFLVIILVQSSYLSYKKNGKIVNILDTLKVKTTVTDMLSNISMSFSHYKKYTFYIYLVLVIIAFLFSIIPFFLGSRKKKIDNSELIWEKQVILLSIIVNSIIIIYNNIFTDLWVKDKIIEKEIEKIEPELEPYEKYFHYILSPLNIILYTLFITWFINNYASKLNAISEKVTRRAEKVELIWIN